MNDRHAKIWLSIFIFTLAVVGGSASFFASEGKTFFKGLEPLRDVIPASVLDAPTENAEQVALQIPEIQTAQEPFIRTKTAVASPCPPGETPVIKNGKIESCGRKHEEKKPELPKPTVIISAPLPPGPKVRILTLPSSCESQGRFTYTGPDRPGLLYGMCIDCGTNIFIMNGGKCA